VRAGIILQRHEDAGGLDLGRRLVLKLILGISGLIVMLHFVPYGSYLSFRPDLNIRRVRIANLSQILPRSSLYFGYPPTGGGILIRDDAGNLYALSPACTHAGCQVLYQSNDHILACPCHGSYFDSETGKVIRGPAQTPLAAIKLEVDKDDDIYAVGVVGED
jgi:nitrite reductase/ring-hydroxylating ferredoxin subunit